MDRRWLAIAIILVIGLGCMYWVAVTSTSVGSAVTIVDDVSVTIPHGFKITNSNENLAVLANEKTNENIVVKHLSDGNNSLNEYNKAVKKINNNASLEIWANSSNDTAHTLYCKDWDTGANYSYTYFDKFDRTTLIKMDNYDDVDKQNRDIMYIITNLQPDYKQNRS